MALYTVSKAVWTTDIYSCEKFLALKQQRLDKIEADKQAAEQRRRELTMLIPLTEKEQKYLPTLRYESDKNDYMKLRFRLMNMFSRFPEEERFKFIVLHAPRRTKLAAASRFDSEKYPAADVTDFDRNTFDRILLSESKRKVPIRN